MSPNIVANNRLTRVNNIYTGGVKNGKNMIEHLDSNTIL